MHPHSQRRLANTLLSSPGCCALLLGAGRTSAGRQFVFSVATASCPAEKRAGATVQEEGQPSTGAREGSPRVASNRQSALLRSSGPRHQVAIVPWGCCVLNSPRFCGSTLLKGASPAAVPAPLGGALRVTRSHSEPVPPQLRRLFPDLRPSPTLRPSLSPDFSPPPSGFRAPPTPQPRPPGPGSPRPACTPGALMSSRDCQRRLTWCLVRISRQDLGIIRQARLILSATAPRGGAE